MPSTTAGAGSFIETHSQPAAKATRDGDRGNGPGLDADVCPHPPAPADRTASRKGTATTTATAFGPLLIGGGRIRQAAACVSQSARSRPQLNQSVSQRPVTSSHQRPLSACCAAAATVSATSSPRPVSTAVDATSAFERDAMPSPRP